MLRPALAALLLVAAGCDAGQEETLPVVQIVGADLWYDTSGVEPTLNVSPETREVGRDPAPPCGDIDLGGDIALDCIAGRSVNETVLRQTRLVADRPVRVGGAVVAAGGDLLGALDGLAEGQYVRERFAVYPFAISSLSTRDLQLDPGRTRLTASWATSDGLAFSSSVSVRR